MASGDLVPYCYATSCDAVAGDTPDLGFVDSGESCCCNSDDACVVVVGCTVVAVDYCAAAGIHSADPGAVAVATGVYAVGAVAVGGEGHHSCFHERDSGREIASLELVGRNPTVSSRLCSSRALSRFVAQDRVRKN